MKPLLHKQKQQISNAGDLTTLAKDLEEVFKKHFPGREKTAMAIAFTLDPDYEEVHWVTNVDRISGIILFEEVAAKMRMKSN